MNELYKKVSEFPPTEQKKLSSIYRITGLPESQNNKILFTVNYYNNEFSNEIQRKLESKINSIFEEYCNSKELETIDRNCQHSAIHLSLFDENISSTCAITNSIHYFKGFIIDRVGCTVLDFGIELKNLLSCPKYETDFSSLLSDEIVDTIISTPKGKTCFNCGSSLHNLNTCDKPKDMAKINSNRSQFLNASQSSINQMSMYSSSRYHEDLDDAEQKFTPGVISKELREVLGITETELPPYIYKMRELGYPPGYKIKSKKDSLEFYDEEKNAQDNQSDDSKHLYGTSSSEVREKIIYPGFNAPVPYGIRDRCYEFGFRPIDPKDFVNQKKRHKSSIDSPSASGTPRPKKNKSSKGDIPEAENEIRLNSASVWSNSRGWWYDGLSVNVFPPKRLWRSPPLLVDVPIFDKIVKNDLIPINNIGISIYGEEEIPTNRLDKIIKYLRSTSDHVTTR